MAFDGALLDLGRLEPSVVSDLLRLAALITVDASGDLVLRNGKSRITLGRDGTILIEGERIIQDADSAIVLSAACIDLN